MRRDINSSKRGCHCATGGDLVGFLRLAERTVLLLRVCCSDLESRGSLRSLWLCAAASAAADNHDSQRVLYVAVVVGSPNRYLALSRRVRPPTCLFKMSLRIPNPICAVYALIHLMIAQKHRCILYIFNHLPIKHIRP